MGYSKERRVDPQIVVGLLVDRTGFPLEIGCFEGNTAETTTLVPIITSFLARHDLAGTPMVVAADAGHALGGEPQSPRRGRGSRSSSAPAATKAPADLESHFHWHGDVFTDGQIIDTVTPRHANTKVNDTALRAEPVWKPDDSSRGVAGDLGVFGQTGPARPEDTLRPRNPRPRHRQRRKGRQVGPIRQDPRRDRSLDEATLARAQSLVGLKGYVTNVAADGDGRLPK